MQDLLRWILILVTIVQIVMVTANRSPMSLSRKQIAGFVFYSILVILALLPSIN